MKIKIDAQKDRDAFIIALANDVASNDSTGAGIIASGPVLIGDGQCQHKNCIVLEYGFTKFQENGVYFDDVDPKKANRLKAIKLYCNECKQVISCSTY